MPSAEILTCSCRWFLYLLLVVDFVRNTTAKLNVLLIVADDLRPSLGCYGAKLLITPHIDNLARQSVVFDKAYAQQAMCGPSRASFLTSRRPNSTHVYDQHTYWREKGGNYTSLPEHFKNNGYLTYSVGKIFHPGHASGKTDDYPYSWSVPPYHPSTQQFKNAKVCPGPDGKFYKNIVCPVNISSMPEKTLPDIQSTQHALQIIKNMSAVPLQPFFLAVGYHKPHIPLKFPKEYLDLYPLENINFAPGHFIPPGLPPVAWNPWADLRERDDVRKLNISFPYGTLPNDYQLLVRQSYYAATTYMDDQVGILLDGLRKYNMTNNTIIVFMSDHGWSLGEHQEWSKYSNFEVALRVPLIVYVPGLTNRGHNSYSNYKISNELVELVDVFPTVAELSGITIPKLCPRNRSDLVSLCTEGLSLASLIKSLTSNIKDHVIKWKSAVFGQFPRPSDKPQENSDQPKLNDIKIMGYTIKTNMYRYTEWVGFDPVSLQTNWTDLYGQELYNHNSDPNEDNNLAVTPNQKPILKELSNMLHKGWRKALPKQMLSKF